MITSWELKKYISLSAKKFQRVLMEIMFHKGGSQYSVLKQPYPVVVAVLAIVLEELIYCFREF